MNEQIDHSYDRLSYLQSYLNLLITLQRDGVRVNIEINQVLKEINKELHISNSSNTSTPVGLTYLKQVAREYENIDVVSEPIVSTHGISVWRVFKAIYSNSKLQKVCDELDMKPDVITEIIDYIDDVLSDEHINSSQI